MYQFQEEFNKTLNQPKFDANLFTLVLELGENFCECSGSTNLFYRKATKTRATYLRMDLAPNHGGVNRLKIHYVSEDLYQMEFYLLDVLPDGQKMKTNVSVFNDVTCNYLLDIFEQVTELYMGRRGDDGAGPTGGEQGDPVELDF